MKHLRKFLALCLALGFGLPFLLLAGAGMLAACVCFCLTCGWHFAWSGLVSAGDTIVARNKAAKAAKGKG